MKVNFLPIQIKLSMFAFFYICIVYLCSIYAQELPPICSYNTQDYGADNQNWSITQTEDKQIFVANNKGLLNFNGEEWNLYPSPNQSIIRSVHAYKGKIYSGCYRDFGYWEKQDDGLYAYHSLVEEFNLSLMEDEQFWKILHFQKYLIFQSLNNIFIYDSDTHSIDLINNVPDVHKTFIVQNQIYFSSPQKGIYQIVNKDAKLVNDAEVFTKNLVINLYEVDGEILVQTDNQGIFTLAETPIAWGGELEPFLTSVSVYNSLQSKKGHLILGTISNGVLLISQDQKLKYNLNQENGLLNNTVLNLFEDDDFNIWLGLDNGINCINQASPIRIFNDESGDVGTVYTSALFQDHLYLGTNQGLFYRPIDNANANFQLVPNSNGQVWDLFIVENTLFCGHNNGAFIVDNFTLSPIFTTEGVWSFKPIPNKNNQLMLGTYKGLALIENTNGNWEFKSKLEGFSISSKFLEFISPNFLFVNHEYKGVYGLELDGEYSKVVFTHKYDEVNKGLYSSIANVGNDVLYAYEDGIFRYNKLQKEFIKDTTLTNLNYEKNQYSSGKLISIDNSNSFWSFTAKGINYISPSKLSNEYEVIFIPIPNNIRNAMSGYENITQLSENLFLFGNSHGYLLLDMDKIKYNNRGIEVQLNSVSARSVDQPHTHLPLVEKIELPSHQNNIKFHFSSTLYDDFYKVEYQYKLAGLNEEWSTWGNENTAAFSNLSFGDYTFKLRSRLGNTISENTIEYPFIIKRPFLLSNLMLAIYVLSLITIILITHNLYKLYYKKQNEKLAIEANREIEMKELEAQRKIMRINNDKLKQDIENKNRELAISTMSLVKKNEFLSKIKNELLEVKEKDSKLNNVLKAINKSLNNSDDWKFFEQAFNNADKDFLKKIKSKHPALTPNDLKLCAYLRLNLSSKEIAPLFNISTRSVEVKRYRLRKKMDLPHEESLTSYILEL